MAFQYFRVLLLLQIALRAFGAPKVELNPDLDAQWENFKKTYQKSYGVDEEAMRRETFEANFQKITEHNQRYDQGLHSFQLGWNEFADMLNEEFVQIMNGFRPGKSHNPKPFVIPDDAVIPDSVDWRNESAVTPVKNQGQCGSCYSFSATGALEGQMKLRKGELPSLSEQNIMDCSLLEGNQGCNGGQMTAAFQYVQNNRGIDSEKSYPYEERMGICHYKRRYSAATCSGYVDVTPSGDEIALKNATAVYGPISVAIDASHDSFQLYTGGVYDESDCSSTELDHGVLVVGYGTTDDNKDYWIVKNSWGTSWGMNGYIWMSRNKNNQCGIATQPSYPLV